jgi:hypothetical protein
VTSSDPSLRISIAGSIGSAWRTAVAGRLVNIC